MVPYFSRSKSSTSTHVFESEQEHPQAAQSEETVVYQVGSGQPEEGKRSRGRENAPRHAGDPSLPRRDSKFAVPVEVVSSSNYPTETGYESTVEGESQVRQAVPALDTGQAVPALDTVKLLSHGAFTGQGKRMQANGQNTDTQGTAVEVRRAQDRIRELEEINRQNAKEMKSAATRISQLERLLEQRKLELQEAQAFLNKPDDYPGSTILRNVERINSEIFNLATHVIDLYERGRKLDFIERNSEGSKEFFERCTQIARHVLGEPLYDFNCQVEDALNLRDPTVPESPVPLQLALQSTLIGWALEVFGNAGSLLGGDGELRGVYDLIQRREEQSVSTQWRTIAYRATKHLRSSSAVAAVERILSVLIICGLSMSDYVEIGENIAKGVKTLEEMLFALQEVAREGITSCDLELVTAGPGTTYDPRTMVDPYSAGPQHSDVRQEVLCSVGFGLQRITVKRTSSKTLQPQSELLKPPEVVLRSLLDEFKKPTDPNFLDADDESESE